MRDLSRPAPRQYDPGGPGGNRPGPLPVLSVQGGVAGDVESQARAERSHGANPEAEPVAEFPAEVVLTAQVAVLGTTFYLDPGGERNGADSYGRADPGPVGLEVDVGGRVTAEGASRHGPQTTGAVPLQAALGPLPGPAEGGAVMILEGALHEASPRHCAESVGEGYTDSEFGPEVGPVENRPLLPGEHEVEAVARGGVPPEAGAYGQHSEFCVTVEEEIVPPQEAPGNETSAVGVEISVDCPYAPGIPADPAAPEELPAPL